MRSITTGTAPDTVTPTRECLLFEYGVVSLQTPSNATSFSGSLVLSDPTCAKQLYTLSARRFLVVVRSVKTMNDAGIDRIAWDSSSRSVWCADATTWFWESAKRVGPSEDRHVIFTVNFTCRI